MREALLCRSCGHVGGERETPARPPPCEPRGVSRHPLWSPKTTEQVHVDRLYGRRRSYLNESHFCSSCDVDEKVCVCVCVF